MRVRRTILSTAVLALAAPGVASAGFFQSEVIDASPTVQRVGDLDTATDGTGAVTYVRTDGSVDHVYASRLVGGAFQPPERVDASLSGAGAQPAVAASNGGRTVVVFTNGGAVYASVRAAGASAFGAPQMLSSNGSDPSVDMSINGVAYASFTAPGSSAADVKVARLDRDQTQFAVLPGALDVTPANDAGNGLGRSHVATSADGTAVVVWGESGHVYARRIFGDHLSAAPQDMNVSQLDGHTGGAADSPWIDIEDDSSYAWAVFRQQFDDGRMHTVARRLVGSAFEAPVAVDGLGYGGDSAATARVDLNGRGEGVITTGSGGFTAFASLIHEDKPFPAVTTSGANTVNSQPVGGESENNDAYAAWFQGTSVSAVSYDVNQANHTVPGPSAASPLASSTFGLADPTAGLDLAVDRVGDMDVVFVQSDGITRRLVSAGFDKPPGSFRTYTSSNWRKASRPTLSWSPSLDIQGVSYDVKIDGPTVATTTSTSIKAPLAPARLTDGVHHWLVVATDRHGQQTTTALRTLRVDTLKPAVALTVTGSRHVGKLLKFKAKVADGSLTAPSGSGVVAVSIAFGDGAVATRRTATHRFRHGKFTVTVRAVDKAGNVTLFSRRLQIKK